MALEMTHRRLAAILVGGLAIIAASSLPLLAALGGQDARADARRSSQTDTSDWPQHNLEIGGGRNSPLNEITTSNVSRLVQKWSYKLDPTDIVNQITPIVLDGAMYFNAGSTLFSLDASTGALRWKYSVEPAFTGSTLGRRGPASDGGHIIYAYGGTGAQAVLYAVDARTGKGVESFGNKGRLQIADAAVRFKYPQKDPTGYEMAAPPIFYKGMLYLGLAQSEKRITGGITVAVDASTGAIKRAIST
jgi:glucose dehydrogenase